MEWDTNGKMNRKLLVKTTRGYLMFSVFVIVLAAPAFFYLSQFLHIYQTDRILEFHKDSFINLGLDTISDKEIAIYNTYNHDVEITKGSLSGKDSVYTANIYDSISGEHELYRVLQAPIKVNGRAYTYTERSHLAEMQEMVYSVALVFLLIIIILMVGITLFSNRWAKKMWMPFYDTLQQIQHFDIDKSKEPHFKATDIDEFDYMNASFDKLIRKNTAIYRNQKEFIENAAHELQTPLTVIQTKLESLFQSAEQSEKQSVLIESINNDLSRMHRLSKNLLLLSSMENEVYAGTKAIAIEEILLKNLDFFMIQAESKEISLETNTFGSPVIKVNPALLEILLNNLYSNAIRHTQTGGSISVSLYIDHLSFRNSGSASLAKDKLFNRFSKSESSSKGNGLGLAIVKKIAELNRWQITYDFDADMHNFTIIFGT